MIDSKLMRDWWQSTFPKGRENLTITDASGYSVSIAHGEKGTGKPLFLVHGIGSWSYGWRHNIDPLAQYFRVICFDAKGHGFSGKPPYAEKLGHQIVEMERIIRGLCDEPAVVVAESLGALIALATAEEYPDLFARLVVINVPIFPERLPNQGMRFLSSIPLEWVENFDNWRLARLLTPLIWQIVAMQRHEVVVNPEDITFEDIYWITYPYLEFPNAIAKYTEELQQSAQEIERLLQNQPNLIRTIQDNLAKITCPTLILWGEQDSWFPATNGEKLHACLPGSRLKIIPNCGHNACAGSPHAINSAILDFLQETDFIGERT